jgi:threonine dehydratase
VKIAGVATRTPVVTSRTVHGQTGADAFFKCENLQRAGAFKFRGAYNALSRLAGPARTHGVVAFSSGNHADMVTVAEAPLLRSMFFLWERLKLVVEPTGALAAAALLEGMVDVRGLRVGVMISGGNVDLSEVAAWRQLA